MKRLVAKFRRGVLTPGFAAALFDLNAPLHPGAIRYYHELGLEIPEPGRAQP